TTYPLSAYQTLPSCLGTVVEGTIQKLFEGHHMNYLECINVDVKSTRKESFYGINYVENSKMVLNYLNVLAYFNNDIITLISDLQLDVKGCKDVYASFDKYVEEERLEGDNKYHAEGHGLQDARKGVLFTDFPPVLELQLKRFEYDYTRDTMVKINDRYEFPLELDLDREGGKYLSPDADKSVRNLYTLHSVLVHSGGISGGHYYAFIRPTLSDQWFKFDDERVTKEDLKKALEDQYGGEEELPQTNPGYNNAPFKFTKYSNAYMLVYIRESDKEKIVCDVNENDIAEHLRETGYVGLKNQGATCYMNSLLQTLYHIPYFRKAVYHMPTTETDMPSGSIPLALQSLFYKLQYNETSVATKELTKSFGWDTYDSFMQHDVQELNRVLCEKLEDKM
ncbi:hypothetical protein M8C21_024664, partial [Ambrosia artemisiifolia]